MRHAKLTALAACRVAASGVLRRAAGKTLGTVTRPNRRIVVIREPADRSEELVFYALAYLDVKYRYGGSDPETGWDCSGYVSHVFKNAIGVTLPRTSAGMSERGESIGRAALKPGDLVFFNTLKRAFSHVGIYIGDNRFVHAPSSGKSVQISDMNSNYWARRFNGGRRMVTQKVSSK